MSSPAEAWVSVAHLLRPQGRHGELLAELLTDFPESLRGREQLRLLPAGRSGVGPQHVTVLSHWLPSGRNQGRIVLKLSGVDTISQAEQLAGADLVVPASSRVALSEGSFYISDLVGFAVVNDGTPVGHIEDVSFPLTSDGTRRLPDAAPLLVVRSAIGGEILIPFVLSIVRRIDHETRSMHTTLPEGLLDLNAG